MIRIESRHVGRGLFFGLKLNEDVVRGNDDFSQDEVGTEADSA